MENRRNSRITKPTNRSDESPQQDDRPRDFTRSGETRSGENRPDEDQPTATERTQSPVGRSRPATARPLPDRTRSATGRAKPGPDVPERPSGRSFDRRREEGRGPYAKRTQDADVDDVPEQLDATDASGRTQDGKTPKPPRSDSPRPTRSGGHDRPRPDAARPESDEMVYGIQTVIETLRSGQQIDKLYMEKELSNPDIQTLAYQNRVTIQRVPVEKLDRLTRKNHQGVVCLVAAVQYVKLSNVMADVFERGETPFLLLLDRITDVRNFGAIARTAECAGVQCIVIPGKGSAAINSDAMKTSSGALNHISVCREFDLVDTINYLQKSGVHVLACTEKSHRDLFESNNDMKGPLAVVMGSEDDGISPDILKAVDSHVKIPLLGQVGSLNVSVATGVALYEVVRQRALAE